MKMRFQNWAGLAALGVAMLVPIGLSAQGRGPKPPEGPAPKLNGKPDFSGLWQRPYVPDMTVTTRNGDQMADPSLPDAKATPGEAAPKGPPGPPRKELPFTEAGKKVWDAYSPAKGDYTGSCLPFGLIRSMNSPDPIQIMQNDHYLSLLYEQNTWFKVFHIDGKAHNDGVATWFGDSVGKWDGDTLVVDTIGFAGGGGTPGGGRVGPGTHLTERFKLTEGGKVLSVTSTWDDPAIYLKPHTYEMTYHRSDPGTYAFEEYCHADDAAQGGSVVAPPQK